MSIHARIQSMHLWQQIQRVRTLLLFLILLYKPGQAVSGCIGIMREGPAIISDSLLQNINIVFVGLSQYRCIYTKTFHHVTKIRCLHE